MCGDDGCRTFAKIILIIVNVICVLAGLLMLAFGIAVVASPDKIVAFFTSTGTDFFSTLQAATGGDFSQIIKAAGIFMIILGAVVILVAAFGFFGACCDNSCMLATYAVILIIIVLAQIALIIFAAVYPKVFTNTESAALYTYLSTNFKRDVQASSTGAVGSNSNMSDIGAQWAVVQFSLKCCGAYNSSDYSRFNWTYAQCGPAPCFSPPPQVVPTSCCIPKNGTTAPQNVNTDYQNVQSCVATASPQYTYTQGCVTATYNVIAGAGTIAIGIAAGIVGLEIILVILAFIMCCTGGGSDKYV